MADRFVVNDDVDVPPTVTAVVAARSYVLFRYKRSSYAPDTLGATSETATGLPTGKYTQFMYALAGVPAAKNASQSVVVCGLRATVMGTLDPGATELATLMIVGVVVPPSSLTQD